MTRGSAPGTLVRVKDQPGPVVIDGDVARRPAGPSTPAGHALLDHLERAGFTGSPHAVSVGGEDVVTYIPGESVSPHAWSDEGVFGVGRLLRGLHDATASFVPPPGAIISHRDTGPWNIAARGGLPVAFIDWVTAGPADPVEKIAATAWLNAQLHDDDIAGRQDLPSTRARAAQLRHFAGGYRLAAAGRRGLVTAMIEYAIRDSAAEAIQAGVTPEAVTATRCGPSLARTVGCLDGPAPLAAGKRPDLNASSAFVWSGGCEAARDSGVNPRVPGAPRRRCDTWSRFP